MTYKLLPSTRVDFSHRIPPNYQPSVSEKIVVLDDVLDSDLVVAARCLVHENRTRGESIWIEKGKNLVIDSLANIAEQYFDLTATLGFETWSAKTNTNYHVDMDESLWEIKKQVQTPECSIVYYPTVENLSGGRFITQTMSVMPKVNRMIVFSPGIYHAVEPYTGIRDALAVNPFKKIIHKYNFSSSTLKNFIKEKR